MTTSVPSCLAHSQGGQDSHALTIAARQLKQHSDRYGSATLIIIGLDTAQSSHAAEHTTAVQGPAVKSSENGAFAAMVAEQLRISLRSTDRIYPCNDSTLAILLPNTDIREAVCLAERLRRHLLTMAGAPATTGLTGAIGLAQARKQETVQQWIERASAMSEHAGLMKQTWVSFDALAERSHQIVELCPQTQHQPVPKYQWGLAGA